jgi:hypothetical protein
VPFLLGRVQRLDTAGATGGEGNDPQQGWQSCLLRQIGLLTRDLQKAQTHEERAVLRSQVQERRRRMKDSAFNIFASPEVKVVVATAFKAVTLLSDPAIRSLAAASAAPFTTVVIDEAGLMSRAVVAGLSLPAARRVVVVGDAKQLAPISKMSRVLPTSQATWLASSCLTHLQRVQQQGSAVHLLREQHRMHPQVSRVVSHYQYEGALCDAPGVLSRKPALPTLLTSHPRAIWYVLDEDGEDLPSIRAERGPGGRSWVRDATDEFDGAGRRQKVDGDEAGRAGGGPVRASVGGGVLAAQASAPGVEGGSGDALAGAEGRDGQAGALEAEQTLTPLLLQGGVGAAARAGGQGSRHWGVLHGIMGQTPAY